MDTGTLTCVLLRCAVRGDVPDAQLFSGLDREQWDGIFAMSCPHNIVALVFDAIQALPGEYRPPKDIWLKFAVLAEQIAEDCDRKAGYVAELTRFYREHDVRLMLLKGIGLSRYYPVPNHRRSSDIDIYLFGEIAKADAILSEKMGISISSHVHHHTTIMYKGVLVENHYDFINVHVHRSSQEIERLLKGMAAEPGDVIDVRGEKVALPTAEFNALFLMRHMAAHYAADRISVRHLCDWMLFLEHEHANIDFTKVNGWYERFNMHRFANALNGLLIEHFGMNADFLPPFERDRDLEERIFNDIFYPTFTQKKPKKGAVKIVIWKLRRFMVNRWKHRIVYNEPWYVSFFRSFVSHLNKPKTITH